MLVCERHDNVTPIVSWTHKHQSGLMKVALDHVTTPHLMFVEHDTPLNGRDIDFGGVLDAMERDGLNLMRFYQEDFVLHDHEHLFLETEPDPDRDGAPYVKTMQWSQRPHVATTAFYRRLMDEYFGSGAVTMIEDVLHGATEFAHRKHGSGGWDEWRLGLYAPAGGFRRSLHLDGRDTDPKFPMLFRYPTGDVPFGAPHPGWDGT